MTNKTVINTPEAPAAIGTYSQAIAVANTVYLSGQIGLDPKTMQLKNENFHSEAEQVFLNLSAVCEAAGGKLSDLLKLNVYLTDLANFAELNEVMASFMTLPYPARAVVQVAALPKGARIEIDGVLSL